MRPETGDEEESPGQMRPTLMGGIDVDSCFEFLFDPQIFHFKHLFFCCKLLQAEKFGPFWLLVQFRVYLF